MPILIVSVEGRNACEQAEELARQLLKSGSVRGGIPLSCHNETAMLQFPDIQQDATKRIVDECKQWCSRKGLSIIESQSIWKKISLSSRGEKVDKATYVMIY